MKAYMVDEKRKEAAVPSAVPIDSASYLSWGGNRAVHHKQVFRPAWRDQISPRMLQAATPVLAHGMGRSYGDSCLNDNAALLVCRDLNRVLAFDEEAGVIRCEAGVSLGEILSLAVPKGWFLPVTPGTKFVTIAGAIANDVHGKNHHREGTIGRHVLELGLIRSDAAPLVCSLRENRELFRATVGGLGLTGVMVWATLKLKKIENSLIDSETIPFFSFEQFLDITREDHAWEYTVAWIDCLSGRSTRGSFFRGNHQKGDGPRTVHETESHLSVPVPLPEWVLNRHSIGLFNTLYFNMQKTKAGRASIHYDPFFYPLDSVSHWNRIYGHRGLVQYQCVVPESEAAAFQEILAEIARAGQGSFLGVIKRFGAVESPGMMSFPRAGFTLALDFPFRGEKTLDLFARLDRIVLEAHGALYPAKDSRMTAEMFYASYPQVEAFRKYLDPAVSSSFWRRIRGESLLCAS